MYAVDHLAGWTIAVTADRRADEQAALLQRRGADVVLAPVVASTPVDDAEVRAATEAMLAAPVDALVATSGAGIRSWLAMSWTWGLGEELLDRLRTTPVLARGAKTVGALAGEDISPAWRAPDETVDEVVARLLEQGVDGRRVAVQLHGDGPHGAVDRLRAAGAEVIAVPVYRTAAISGERAAERLTLAAARGELDAITCTSAAAVHALAAIDGLVDDLHANGVACAVVGPLTAAAARAADLPEVVVADPHRLGSMVRALGEHLAARGRSLEVAGVAVRHQGSRISVDGAEARLTPRERRLLEVMLATEGAVLSKDRLAAIAWDAPVDEHTVEVAINRLRRKLGPAAVALETTNRRGYRIAL